MSCDMISLYKVRNTNLKNISLFFVKRSNLKRTSEASHSAGGSGGWKPAPGNIFANLNLLKALIFRFWCLKKINLKGCDHEN